MPICHPKFSKVDSDLNDSTWYLTKLGYARRNVWLKGKGKIVCEFAQRIVLSRKLGIVLTRWQLSDHRNFDKMDCTRRNIRLLTPVESSQHRQFTKTRGTTLHKCGRWQATAGYNGKNIYLGLFKKRSDAIRVARQKRKELGYL
jgi:hypothetical protein